MSITWNKKFVDEASLFDFVYTALKAAEAGGVAAWLKPSPPGGNSGITIGIGFDLKKGTPAERLAVLNVMGLQTDLLGKGAATLSASEKIELRYVSDLLTAVQGTDLAAVRKLMSDRANDVALRDAMVVEGKTYERRAQFEFKTESEVRAVYDVAKAIRGRGRICFA